MTDTELAKQAELVCCGGCTFAMGVADLAQLPAPDRNEIAFAGRSNVGKSSLINAVFCQKNLARASSTPGRTQQLNYFDLNSRAYIVDLPGYGYARASEKQVKDWNQVVFAYLKGRPNLRRVFLLIDSRHGLKEKDKEVMKMLDKSAVSYQIVLTKIDKIKQSSLEEVLSRTQREIEQNTACHPEVLRTSAEKKQGLSELRQSLTEML